MPGSELSWLHVTRGDAPLVVSLPHTGTDFPEEYAQKFPSLWLARKDADWWIDRLYDFTARLGATIIRTSVSRSVIDVNRDPSGVSLYPGQATTELCPTTTFDGEPLYADGGAPDAAEIARRRKNYFDPYHTALAGEIARLRAEHPRVVLYDCHSIRSKIPRLFDGVLPHFNMGTNSGAGCAQEMAQAVAACCAASRFSHVLNGRFKGGYITRHYGAPARGIHAIQMELACRAYMIDPPKGVSEMNWPAFYSEDYSAHVREVLERIFAGLLAFAAQERVPGP